MTTQSFLSLVFLIAAAVLNANGTPLVCQKGISMITQDFPISSVQIVECGEDQQCFRGEGFLVRENETGEVLAFCAKR